MRTRPDHIHKNYHSFNGAGAVWMSDRDSRLMKCASRGGLYSLPFAIVLAFIIFPSGSPILLALIGAFSFPGWTAGLVYGALTAHRFDELEDLRQ